MISKRRVSTVTLVALVMFSSNAVLPRSATAAEKEGKEEAASGGEQQGPSPWRVESATGLNDYGRVIDNAIAESLGRVSQTFLARSFHGVSLGDKYTPPEDDLAADPWLLPIKENPRDDANQDAIVRVLVDSKTNRIVGILAFYKRQPLEGMIESIKETFGKTSQEIDSRDVSGFDFDNLTLKYTFPRTIVRVSGNRFETRILILDRDYAEASLRPFANAVVSACRWVKEVANYGNAHKNGPLPDLPLADLRHVRTSDQRMLLLFDESAQKTARTRHKDDLEVCRWDIAVAWNNQASRGAVLNLLACDSIGVPTLLLSKEDYVDRTLATTGLALDLFHDVGSALVQSEFPPAGDKITVRNPKRSWDGDCTAFVKPVLGEDDDGIYERAQCLEEVGQPQFLRRAYEWKDKQGWQITWTESLILTLVREER